ncbi:aprataxin [Copidosoma floridanum]|uniref:aprataxin n=1 Tax=Copidosoma floridanum TaxID=29053 RepID=UPI0006C95265|nr:aprataxin [Copidosoma floridanum]
MSNSALGASLIKKHWSLGLLTDMNNPEAKLKEDDQIVVIKDKYPKARHHILILPKKNIADLTAVTRDDSKILYHMDAVAREFVSRHNEYEFKVGYHAVPSMKQLHLHVISTDFDSPCLKTKIHWNSFNTAFFISSTVSLKLTTGNKNMQSYQKNHNL